MGCKEAFVSTQTLRIGDPHRGLRHKLPTSPQSGPQGEIFAAKRSYGNLNITSFFIGENSIDSFSIHLTHFLKFWKAENCYTDRLCAETNDKSHKPQHFVLAVVGCAKRDFFVHLYAKIILLIRPSAKLFSYSHYRRENGRTDPSGDGTFGNLFVTRWL